MKTKRRYFVIQDGKPVERVETVDDIAHHPRSYIRETQGCIELWSGVLSEKPYLYHPGQWYYIDEPIEVEHDGWCLPNENNLPNPHTFMSGGISCLYKEARPVRLVWADEGGE